MSSGAPKNNGVKTYKDALSTDSFSFSQDLPFSADFMIDRNVRSEATDVSGNLKNGNNIAVAAENGFTAVKGITVKK
jgi:hypothetical protein